MITKHYENLPMQYTVNSSIAKIDNFIGFIIIIIIIIIIINFDLNSDCGYTLEPPHRGGSTVEYPQCILIIYKKNSHTPVNPSFSV